MAKIVIAPDSFKGSLTAAQVADAVARGIIDVMPDAEVTQIPVADGGEGTAEIITEATGGSMIICRATDPLGHSISARYGIAGDMAIIELAEASGLTRLSPAERNPLITSTYGTGLTIADAYARGCRRFAIGLGGSATNDGGAGILRALGFRFLDMDGHELPDGGRYLAFLDHIDSSDARMDITRCGFTLMCDVDNPLTGPNGASAIFGPQKGATRDDITELDHALANYADHLQSLTGNSVDHLPGAGAAGGAGAAFLACFNARFQSGIDTVLDTVGFDNALNGADIVITGEGRIDSQTLNGKAPFGVTCRAMKAGIPVIAIAGCVEDRSALLSAGFAETIPVHPPGRSSAEAMNPDITIADIRTTARKIAYEFSQTNL